MKHSVPTKNDALSWVQLNHSSILALVGGEYKILRCDPSVFSRVMGCIDGKTSFDEIISEFKPWFKTDQTRCFLETLASENIIKFGKEPSSKKEDTPFSVALIGNNPLSKSISKALKAHINCFEFEKPAHFYESESQSYDTIIFAGENDTVSTYRELNSYVMGHNIPLLVTYYNGKGIVLGPYIFPWKTPCLECHFVHHLRALGQTLEDDCALDSLNDLQISYQIPSSYAIAQVVHAADIIATEVLKLLEPNQTFDLVRCEKTLQSHSADFDDIKLFQTISSCPVCHGMNDQYKVNFDIDTIVSCAFEDTNSSDEIVYRKGGFRSKTADETQEILNQAFSNIGFDIQVTLMEKNPFASVLPVYDSYIKPTHNNKTPYSFGEQLSHGKGFEKQQAFFSASFEIFERMSARYYGDVPVYCATPNELGEHAINLESLVRHIENPCTAYEKYDPNMKIDWVIGHSLCSGKPIFVPASLSFLTAAVFRGKFFNDTSSGLAAGATKDDALLQGLLELIEHDAWLIGQCNTFKLPCIDLESTSNQKTSEVVHRIRDLGYGIITRDYTSDIGIPVFRTWIFNPNNFTRYATSGFGSSLDPEVALERSITEAVQASCEQPAPNIKQYESVNMRDLIYTRDSLYGLYYFQQKDIKRSDDDEIRSVDFYKQKSYETVRSMINGVLEHITQAIPDADVVYVDLTKESIGIPVVRTLITGNIQRMSLPLIAVSPRLYDRGVSLGYTVEPPAYDELYMGPYPH